MCFSCVVFSCRWTVYRACQWEKERETESSPQSVRQNRSNPNIHHQTNNNILLLCSEFRYMHTCTHTHSAYWLIHTHIGCSVCQLCDDKNQFYQVRVIVSQTNKQTHTHIHIANSSQLRCSRRHLPPPPQWFQSIWTKCAPMKSKPTTRHSHICQQKPYVSRKNNNSVWTW